MDSRLSIPDDKESAGETDRQPLITFRMTVSKTEPIERGNNMPNESGPIYSEGEEVWSINNVGESIQSTRQIGPSKITKVDSQWCDYRISVPGDEMPQDTAWIRKR